MYILLRLVKISSSWIIPRRKLSLLRCMVEPVLGLDTRRTCSTRKVPWEAPSVLSNFARKFIIELFENRSNFPRPRLIKSCAQMFITIYKRNVYNSNIKSFSNSIDDKLLCSVLLLICFRKYRELIHRDYLLDSTNVGKYPLISLTLTMMAIKWITLKIFSLYRDVAIIVFILHNAHGLHSHSPYSAAM